MEGIDRLHQIAEDVGRTVWLRDLGAALSDTADAIEGGMRDLSGYESDVLAWVEKNGGLDAVNERTMPDDMEWPRYADGSPVEIGDDVIGPDYGERIHVDEVIFHSNGFTLRSKGDDGKWYESEDRFERPAVLAADGEPLEVGQTVWVAENGNRFHVVWLCDDGLVQGTLNGDLMKYLRPEQLTHQRPVLDADGVPIHEGDTVYLLPGEWCGEYPLRYYSAGDEMVVKELCPDHEFGGVLKCAGDGKCTCFPLPRQLTHTKPEPDSWSSVWADVSNGNETPEGMMRRCRALAERGER